MIKKIAVILILSLLIASCGSDKIVRDDNRVYFSGTVLAEYPEGVNLDLRSPYYTVNTDRKARISLFHEYDEILYSFYTDDFSKFRVSVEPGYYDILVESPHSFPKYFSGIDLTRDADMNLDIKYDFSVIDTLLIDFYYGTTEQFPPTKFNEGYERQLLEELNEDIGNHLNVDDAIRFSSDDIYTNHIFSSYRIPLKKGVFTYDAVSRAQMFLRPGISSYPEQMHTGYQTYLVFIEFHNGGIDIVLDPGDFTYVGEPYINFYGDSNFYDPPDSIYWH